MQQNCCTKPTMSYSWRSCRGAQWARVSLFLRYNCLLRSLYVTLYGRRTIVKLRRRRATMRPDDGDTQPCSQRKMNDRNLAYSVVLESCNGERRNKTESDHELLQKKDVNLCIAEQEGEVEGYWELSEVWRKAEQKEKKKEEKEKKKKKKRGYLSKAQRLHAHRFKSLLSYQIWSGRISSLESCGTLPWDPNLPWSLNLLLMVGCWYSWEAHEL